MICNVREMIKFRIPFNGKLGTVQEYVYIWAQLLNWSQISGRDWYAYGLCMPAHGSIWRLYRGHRLYNEYCYDFLRIIFVHTSLCPNVSLKLMHYWVTVYCLIIMEEIVRRSCLCAYASIKRLTSWFWGKIVHFIFSGVSYNSVMNFLHSGFVKCCVYYMIYYLVQR